MKRFATLLMVLMWLLCLTVTAAAASAEEQRAEIRKLSNATLERLYEKYPHAERVISECYAYATLSNSGVKVIFFGNARGRGLAHNNVTDEDVFLKMREVSGGLGIGAKEYDLIFVFDDAEAWESFVAGKTRFGGSAEASASDGVSGGAVEGADYAAKGTWVYQMTTKGLALEATLKGTKIYKDKSLNKHSEAK